MSTKKRHTFVKSATAASAALVVTTLIATPVFADEANPDGNAQAGIQSSDPVTEAQTSVDTASINLQDAQDAQAEAVTAENEAQANYNQAQTNVSSSEQEVVDAKNEAGIAAAENDVTTAQDNLESAQASQTQVEAALPEAESVVPIAEADTALKAKELEAANADAAAANEKNAGHDHEALTEADTQASATLQADAADQKLKEDTQNKTSAQLSQADKDAATAQQNAVDATPENIAMAKQEAEKAANKIVEAEAAVHDIQGAVTEAQSALEKAEKALALANNSADISQADLAKAQAAYDKAQSDLATAQAKNLTANNTLELAQNTKDAADDLVAATSQDVTAKQNAFNDAVAAQAIADQALADQRAETERLKKLAENVETIEGLDAYSYFQDMNATDAYRILTDSAVTKYLSTVGQGELSATSLDNMIRALEYISECNEIRAGLGLPELQVSDTAMAAAIANADYTVSWFNQWGGLKHSQQWGGLSENIAYTPGERVNPFTMWYNEEKVVFDNAVASGSYPGLTDMTAYQIYQKYPDLYNEVGHYLNIIDPSATITGFGVSQNGTYTFQAQEFSTGKTAVTGQGTRLTQGRIMSPADYLQSLKDYQALNGSTTGDDAAQKAYEDSLVALADAQAKADSAKSALDQATSARQEADKALSSAQAVQAQADKDLAAAVSAVNGTEKKVSEAEAVVNDRASDLSQAKKAADNDAATAAQKKADAIAAQQALENAQTAYDQAVTTSENAKAAKTDADNYVDALTNANDLLEQAQEARDKAQKANDQAVVELDKANAKLEDSTTAYEKAHAAWSSAHDDYLNVLDAEAAQVSAQSAYDKALAFEKQAKEHLNQLKDQRDTADADVAYWQGKLDEAETFLSNLTAQAAIDTPIAEAKLAQAQAALGTAKERLDNAITAREAADAGVKEAQASYDQALADLQAAKDQASKIEQAIKDQEKAKQEAESATTEYVEGVHRLADGRVFDVVVASESSVAGNTSETTSSHDLVSTGDDLAYTGAATTALLGGALTLFALGGGLSVAARRRHEN